MHFTKVLSLMRFNTAEIRENNPKTSNTELVILLTGPILSNQIAAQFSVTRVRGLFSQAVHLEYQNKQTRTNARRETP